MFGLKFRGSLLESKAVMTAAPEGIDRGSCLCLDRNESARPLSPRAAAAIRSYLLSEGCHRYPSEKPLTAAVARHCSVPEEWVLPTNGSDQGIEITLRAFLSEGSTMLIAEPGFLPFRRVAQILGARVDGVRYEPDFTFPYAAFRAAAAQNPDIIVFINPNNPTGSPVEIEFIEDILASHPETPVIVDEAYVEFTGRTATALVGKHRNLIVLRTFSKAFAMAGLRLGYVIADSTVIEQLGKLRNPFDINQLAIVAATAQLDAPDEVRGHVTEIVSKTKPEVLDFFANLGIPVVPGAANFLLVQPDDCARTVGLLREARVLVHQLTGPLVEGMFRLTVGTQAEMEEFMRIYRTVHEQTRRL
jgi:histidinol-phosphate aminotransferase